MIYRKTGNYDKFKCIADKCPESCCELWQIVIDDDSLEKYRNKSGETGKLLKEGVDWSEDCFKQVGRRCAMLRSDGLCELQKREGEEILCDTCRLYPRHTEEFENEREYSLSLSCPEAARIILTNPDRLEIIETEDDEEEVDEEFDNILYGNLFDARQKLFDIIHDRSLSIERRLNLTLNFGGKLQDALDDGSAIDMGEMLEKYDSKIQKPRKETLISAEMGLMELTKLETLHENWSEILLKTFNHMFSEDGYDNYLKLSPKLSVAAEQLLFFFTYTYFDGAVYDGMIYTKTALAIYSVRWILMIYETFKKSEDDMETLIWAAYTYAREIEHSDQNLDALEEYFDGCRVR